MCQKILSLQPREEAKKEHHENIESLMHSVGQGCFVCISVERASTTVERESTNLTFRHTTYQWVAREQTISKSMPRPWALDIGVYYNPKEYYLLTFSFLILDLKTEGMFMGLTVWAFHTEQYRFLSRCVTFKTKPINENKRDVQFGSRVDQQMPFTAYCMPGNNS